MISMDVWLSVISIIMIIVGIFQLIYAVYGNIKQTLIKTELVTGAL